MIINIRSNLCPYIPLNTTHWTFIIIGLLQCQQRETFQQSGDRPDNAVIRQTQSSCIAAFQPCFPP